MKIFQISAAVTVFLSITLSGCHHPKTIPITTIPATTRPATTLPTSESTRIVTHGDREKFVPGDQQHSFPSPDSGAADLARQLADAIHFLNYGDHRFVLVGFGTGRDKSVNRFGEVLLESLTFYLQQSVGIQLTTDRSMLADVLDQMSLEKSDIYDDKMAAQLGRAVGATAVLNARMELMPMDRNINVYIYGIDIESALPIRGLSAKTLFDYSGDNQFLWDEGFNNSNNMDFQIQLVGQRYFDGAHFPVTPGTALSEGDGIKLWIRANRDCWLYVINRDTAGNLRVLFPHDKITRFGNPIPAGTEVYLPPEDTLFYVLDDRGVGGIEEIWWAVAQSPRQDIETLIHNIEQGQGIRYDPDRWMHATRGLDVGSLDQSTGLKKKPFHLPTDAQTLLSYHFQTADVIKGGIFSFRHIERN